MEFDVEFFPLPKRAEDLTGQRFMRLNVLGPMKRPPHIKGTITFMWLCQCDCGTEKLIMTKNLKNGGAKSCGCWKREAAWVHDGNASHGLSSSLEYSSWKGMIRRCTNPNFYHFHRYGGAGITVCDRWRKFENFYADMGPRPSPSHTIDRFPDKNGDYEPGNCRWATRKEQSINTKTNLIVTAFGRTCALAEFFENSICSAYSRTHYRIGAGWDPEYAIKAPAYAKRR